MKERMSLDNRRSVFCSIGTSVFDIIESAIHVAAADHPDELAARRDRIAEELYTSGLRHFDRAANEQRESSSGVRTVTRTRTDGTEAEADVPGAPGVRMSLDNWRSVFCSIGTSVFDIIESAIHVAAADHPDELAARRDRIAEVLYTSGLRHFDRAANEQRESSSGVRTVTRTRTDGTEAEADVPGAPGVSFIGKEFDADDNLAGGSAANSDIRCEFDEGSASKPSEEQVPAQSIRPEDTSAKTKCEDATNESPEPRDVPNKNPKPASCETMKCPQNQNQGQSEVLNAPACATKAATQQHSDDKSLAEKLEATRMKFRQKYEAAKKPRTVRLELHEIPKPNKKDSNKNR